MYDLKAFYGPNAGYVLELYERYRQNPALLMPSLVPFSITGLPTIN